MENSQQLKKELTLLQESYEAKRAQRLEARTQRQEQRQLVSF